MYVCLMISGEYRVFPSTVYIGVCINALVSRFLWGTIRVPDMVCGVQVLCGVQISYPIKKMMSSDSIINVFSCEAFCEGTP